MIVLTDEQLASLAKFAESASKERGLEALHINVRGTRSRPIIEIVLDGLKDVQVADCEHVSRSVQANLDAMFNQEVNYRLDVTSPGTDEPLNHDYQFTRNIGRNVEITLEEDKKLTGKLLSSDSGSIAILPKTIKNKQPDEIAVSRADIKKAKVVVGF